MSLLAALLASLVPDFVLLDPARAYSFAACDALALGFALLLSPLSYEDVRTPILTAVACCILVVTLRLLSLLLFPACAPPWLTAAFSELFFFGTILFRFSDKYRNIRQLFDNIAAWNSVEDNARSVYAAALLIVCQPVVLVAVSESVSVFWRVATMALSLAFVSLLYVRSYFARTFFVSKKTEKRIMDVISGNMRSCPVPGVQDDGMIRLYRRIVAYMEGHTPFLSPKFGLEELAKGVLTNKSYVSRTVNILSGRNVCAFINYYRIKYAVSLVESDPNLKVMEIAMMSGYNTIVSFNSAFKTFMRETPREYIEKVRDRKRPSLSNYRGPAQKE